MKSQNMSGAGYSAASAGKTTGGNQNSFIEGTSYANSALFNAAAGSPGNFAARGWSRTVRRSPAANQ